MHPMRQKPLLIFSVYECLESDVYRYADFDFHPVAQHLLICVKEDHSEDTPCEVKTSIVLVNTITNGIVELCPALEKGFYAFPRFGGKEGSKVAWIEVSARGILEQQNDMTSADHNVIS